ncbi:MATE family efflux transporter [Melghirimyces algeriensis]|uniref:Putative efflux protein, MATE family n=1 Tax=Melghirimyces algeriensis TaxID=910412 RepID=A0A521FIU9_9BACL|nr:MATE family efflux transporter [Melghirimyces algeriensis]SMO95531.1 putative efflux protein, MATE family [Melghirimyces algeriensis]
MKKRIIQLAFPIFIESALVMVDGLIHIIWVGQLLGGTAVATVGACFPIILAMSAVANGAARVTSTPMLRRFQAKKKRDDAVQKQMNVSWSFAIFTVMFVTVGVYLTAPWVLTILGTPEGIMEMATGYLRIMALGFTIMYFSFLITSLLRDVGYTFARMLFIAIATAGNLVLVPMWITGMGPFPKLGLYGAVFASFIVSVLAIIVSLGYLLRHYKGLLMRPTQLRWDRNILASLLPLSMPVFIQQFLLALGYTCIIIFVNPFGSDATAAFYVISRIDSIVALPAMAVMIAMTILMKQSVQGKKLKKIKSLFRWGLLINFPFTFLIALSCFLFPDWMIKIFVTNPSIVAIGVDYLQIISFGYLLFTLLYACNGIINGAGKGGVTLVFSLSSLIVIRVPVAAILTQMGFKVTGVWFAVLASFIALAACSWFYYLSGVWKKKWEVKEMKVQGTMPT